MYDVTVNHNKIICSHSGFLLGTYIMGGPITNKNRIKQEILSRHHDNCRYIRGVMLSGRTEIFMPSKYWVVKLQQMLNMKGINNLLFDTDYPLWVYISKESLLPSAWSSQKSLHAFPLSIITFLMDIPNPPIKITIHNV